MKDILQLHTQASVYSKGFETFEIEMVQFFQAIANEEQVQILLNNKIYERLTTLYPELKNNPKIFTYQRSAKELYSETHPLRKIYSKDAIKFLVDNKINNKNLSKTSKSIMMICDMQSNYNDHTGLMVFEASTVFVDDQYFPKTKAIVDEYFSGWKVNDFAEYYLETVSMNIIFKNLPVPSAQKFGQIASKACFLARLDELMIPILNKINYSDTTHLLGVFLDIASMTQKQVDYFVAGYYSTIPFIGHFHSPTSAVTIRRQIKNLGQYNDDIEVLELFIKGQGLVAHIIYYYNAASIGIQQFDCYITADRETVNLFGQDFCIDDDFITGLDLDLFRMVTIDYDHVTTFTDFTFDYEKSFSIALTEPKDAGLYDYLLDMEGRYHRLKQS
ncbi:hypothetical protein ACI51W_03515 [Pseudomonas marginalis]|uniref:hypothetical protein n=1 Tax=Pseudomonas marginalis TaxID=298 RepID=UPI00386EC186